MADASETPTEKPELKMTSQSTKQCMKKLNTDI